jgi:small subunit ribosomal protein S14
MHLKGDIIQLVEYMFCKYKVIGSNPIISIYFMKKKIKKNIKQRYLFKNFEKKRLILKILLNNLNINIKNRLIIKQKWYYFSNNTSLTRIKNLCILTGRSKSIYRLVKLSRIKFRKYISEGILPGFSKYSW